MEALPIVILYHLAKLGIGNVAFIRDFESHQVQKGAFLPCQTFSKLPVVEDSRELQLPNPPT